MDSGSPFHSARNDGGAGWLVSVPYQRIPMCTANQTTVIPAKAGIQYLGMDSGSPFHFARNDEAVISRSADIIGLAGVLRVSAPSRGAESLFVYSNKKGRKNAAPVIPLFLCFSARPGVGRRVPSRGQRRPSMACPCGPDPAEPAMLGRDEGETGTARRLSPASRKLGAAQRAVRPSTLHARRWQSRLEGSIGQGWPIEVRATGSGSHRPWKA